MSPLLHVPSPQARNEELPAPWSFVSFADSLVDQKSATSTRMGMPFVVKDLDEFLVRIDDITGAAANLACQYWGTYLSATESGITYASQPRPVRDQVQRLRDEVVRRTRLTREQIARALGVDRRSLSSWVNGTTVPTTERHERVGHLTALVREIDALRPGEATEVLLARRKGGDLLDVIARGDFQRARNWQALEPGHAAAHVTTRKMSRPKPPLYAAALAAYLDGKPTVPPRQRARRLRARPAGCRHPLPRRRDGTETGAVSVISADQFYAQESGGLQQGDILLSGVSRIIVDDGYSPLQWDQLDAQEMGLDGANPTGEPIRLFAGFGLVMVTSHDCQLEKEWNRRRAELLAQGRSEDDAEAAATADDLLDRSVVVSPLIDPDDLISVDRGNLLGGHIVGSLPVPAAATGNIPESVVDLIYRCTVDRLDVVRVASLTPPWQEANFDTRSYASMPSGHRISTSKWRASSATASRAPPFQSEIASPCDFTSTTEG